MIVNWFIIVCAKGLNGKGRKFEGSNAERVKGSNPVRLEGSNTASFDGLGKVRVNVVFL